MSGAPPPYPGNPNEKGGPYDYPGPPQPYGPPQPGYPPQAGYPPQPAPPYGFSQPGHYGPPPGGPQLGNYGPPPGGPQPSYRPPQQHGQQHHTVVVTQPPVALIQTFQAIPVRCVCPHCRAEIVTATHFESGTFSWVMCVILCLLGCNAGCCLIPFCAEGCQDVIHTCPNCHQHISRWSRM